MAATHRYILHVDVDEFFVQVERQHDPTLIGKPIIVYQLAETTCVSYEARLLGVRKDMDPTHIARMYPTVTRVFTLSIEGKTTYRWYLEASMKLFDCIRAIPTISVVEKGSWDEAWLDITKHVITTVGHGSTMDVQQERLAVAMETAKAIQAAALEATGLKCSIGIAENKILAKLGSRQAKPYGIFTVTSANQAEVLSKTKIWHMPGHGGQIADQLNALGAQTVADVQRISQEQLTTMLGDKGQRVWEICRGIDSEPVVDKGLPKSLRTQMSLVLSPRLDHGSKRPIKPVPVWDIPGVSHVAKVLADDLARRVDEDSMLYNRHPTNLIVTVIYATSWYPPDASMELYGATVYGEHATGVVPKSSPLKRTAAGAKQGSSKPILKCLETLPSDRPIRWEKPLSRSTAFPQSTTDLATSLQKTAVAVYKSVAVVVAKAAGWDWNGCFIEDSTDSPACPIWPVCLHKLALTATSFQPGGVDQRANFFQAATSEPPTAPPVVSAPKRVRRQPIVPASDQQEDDHDDDDDEPVQIIGEKPAAPLQVRCDKCHELIHVEDMSQHLDFHVAFELQEDLRDEARSSSTAGVAAAPPAAPPPLPLVAPKTPASASKGRSRSRAGAGPAGGKKSPPKPAAPTPTSNAVQPEPRQVVESVLVPNAGGCNSICPSVAAVLEQNVTEEDVVNYVSDMHKHVQTVYAEHPVILSLWQRVLDAGGLTPDMP